MKFKDFELKSDNYFIAMQYYGLILNRTFLVLITKDSLIGIKVNGMVSIEVPDGKKLAQQITRAIVNQMAIKDDLQNPFSYIKSKYIENIDDYELLDNSILKQNKANFIIHRAEIANIYYDPQKKWGMGYYPHDGKVYIETYKGKKLEFIILGNQSGQKIVDILKKTFKNRIK